MNLPRRSNLSFALTVVAVAVGIAACGPSRPPPASLAIDSEVVELVPYSLCWTETNWWGGGSGMCGEGAPDDGKPQVTVSRGTAAELTFDGDAPQSIQVSARRDSAANERFVRVPLTQDGHGFEVNVEPDTWHFDIFAVWPQGSASFSVPLAVQ